MSKSDEQPPVDDGYLAYYAEKLWEWIPEVYRNEDAALVSPAVLRAFVETFAAEAAKQRRSIDRLWEDTIIDYADDWAVPYIGTLLGTRLLSPLNRRRRVDVAKTIAYRRRAGTPYLMEELIHDITGWHGAISEGFQRMARTHHNLDVAPHGQTHGGSTPALHRQTPAAGTANLRLALAGERVAGAFDSFYHRADVRRSPPRAGDPLRSSRGLYDLSRLTFHLYRQKANALSHVTPYALDERRHTLDPSGRDVPLFSQGKRPFSETKDVRRLEKDGLGWSPAQRWQLPAPLSCRLFNSASYRPAVTDFETDTQRQQFQPLIGEVFETKADLRQYFERLSEGVLDWALFRQLVASSIEGTSPKYNLYGRTASIALGFGDHFSHAELGSAEVVAADLAAWHTPPALPPEAELLVDVANGRVLVEAGAPAGDRLYAYLHHYGSFDNVGAGTYDRARSLRRHAEPLALTAGDVSTGELGDVDVAALDAALTGAAPGETKTIEVASSATLRWSADSVTVPNLVLQAADRQRPYVRLEPSAELRFTIEAAALPEGPPRLVLDGLWLGLRHADDGVLDEELDDPLQPATPVVASLRLSGVFDEVVLRHMTLDPGGECARIAPTQARAIPALRLEIDGYVQRLVIDRCIVGSILEIVNVSADDPCSAGSIEIADSIVVAAGDGTAAIDASSGTLTLKRSTVLGDVVVNRLYASEALIDGIVRVTDSQQGCFRFSAAASGNTTDPASASYRRLPKRFESHLFEGGVPADSFVSKRFGDPGFVQLAASAPRAIRRGAENGSEIGAYNRAFAEILLADLRAKIDEYKPIQVIGQFIFET